MNIVAGKLLIQLNEDGDIVSWKNTISGEELISIEHRSPLIRLVVEGRVELPSSMVYAKESGIMTLKFSESGASIDIGLSSHEHYASLEVLRIAGIDADAVIWGPFMTTMNGSIGESVGIIHDSHYAFGLQSLNLKTVGGWPAEQSKLAGVWSSYSCSEQGKADPDNSQPSDNKFEYEVCAAWPTNDGSMLQAFARNRAKAMRRPVWNLSDVWVAPIEGEDARIEGTKIALFGCPVEQVLDVIERIELGEGLPHPIIEGEWGKRSSAANQSYLITDFSEATIDDAVRYTRMSGLKYVYHPDPFENWGHFKLKSSSFPNGDKGMKACVETAAKEGVNIGLHTLSNFTTLNDPYVTPVPSEQLQKVGSSLLVSRVSADANEMEIDDPQPFAASLFRRSAQIGSEIIEYESVTESAPWKLLGVKRGVHGTVASEHEANRSIGRLWDHPYDVFFPNDALQDQYADRIGELFQTTGLKQISFDGLEGVYATGQDGYGVNRFVKQCYDKWSNEVINDASIVVPNYLWHIFTRFNWGEPWGAATREGQLEWRLSNQRYFKRNFIPPMLGWFLIRSHSDRFEATQLDEVEWVLSKAAGFDAGFAIVADMGVLGKNGNSEQLLQAVSEWEKVRQLGAFTPEQKERLREAKGDWHLEAIGDHVWHLYAVHVSKPLECNPAEQQPGQPGGADWTFFNRHNRQPLKFCLRVSPSYGNDDASILRPTFYTNGVYMTFDTEVKANQYLVCDGDRSGKVFDLNWNLISTVQASADSPVLQPGGQALSFSCKFTGDPKPIVSVKVSTWGEPEKVQPL